MDRSPAAARQLASRARRRVRGAAAAPALPRQRETVEAFLAALQAGDLAGLLAVLDPAVVRRADRVAVPSGQQRVRRGAGRVAEEALRHKNVAPFARPVVVNRSAGILVAPQGRLRMVISCTVRAGKIIRMEVIAEPVRLAELDLSVPQQ